MKRIIFTMVFVSGLFLTGCENGDITDETAEIEFEISKTDKGDSTNPGGSGNDPVDDDED